jgi:dipeptidyl aminopeptidase/acylaminoacyl peptidase
MLDMVRIGDVTMTPDGAKVFYSERRLNWEKNKYEKTFLMISSRGGKPVVFVKKDGGESFQISPDGKVLSMLRKVDEDPQIFLMSLDGGEPWQLTEHRGEITGYKWSGDGQSIVFAAKEAMSEEDKKELELGADPIFVNEGPNGKNHGRWNTLWRVDTKSKEESQVTDEEMLIDGFDVSPDGARVVFTARLDNRGNFPFLSELYVVQTDGKNLGRLTDNRALETDPVWAPDGESFVFHASHDRELDLRNGYLWIMNPDTGELRRLEGQNTGEIDHLVWTPDGKSLLFNEVHGTNTNLFKIDIASGKMEALTNVTGTFRVMAYSRDRSKIAYTFDDFDTPADLHASDLHGESSVRLTHANPWIEKEILLPKSRVIRWESSGGTPIEGIFMLPADYREGTRVPLILEIHGGPSGYWANAFEPDLIIYTGLGYAVLGPNVRGSSGYGDSILRGLMGDIGGGEYRDLITGVDHVIEAGYIDPDKMGVAGWSWGGVSAGWVITQTNRFKAASVGAGVSNWIGESGPGFNWDVSNWYIGGKHWTERDEWRKRSAINYVGSVETPTLFLHGEKDQTSSTNQSMVYFDALQELGVPTRFIKFPRQAHGIREPRLLRVRIVEEVRWMQKYVLGQEWTHWERKNK